LLIKLTEFSITQEERHRAFFHFSNFAGDVTLQGSAQHQQKQKLL